MPALVGDEGPGIVQHVSGGLRARSKHTSEATAEHCWAEEVASDTADKGVCKKLLHEDGAGRVLHKAAV
eukprot:CAMPEP_0196776818 /NCGR_PEP_ID=MMETSP1104-20130614/4858_1 /TAXON_ID=33652 /ORGANISM="Cafeteria sp., Strain Caron Lab Isolate" /LENGTH=68 /DNA_ID=CAMNT_0042146985 /DNA_START=69 /DNA_END=275 /DNA_ORIENTATION=+